MVNWLGVASEVATAQQFEQEALRRLQADIGCDCAFLSMLGAPESPTTVGLDWKLVEKAVQRGPQYLKDLAPVKRLALRGGGVAVDSEVLGQSQLKRTSYYRDLMQPIGGNHSLLAYLPLRGQIVAALMLGRRGKAFSHAEISRLQAQLSALAVARASYGLPSLPPKPLNTTPRSKWSLKSWTNPAPLAQADLSGAQVQVRDRNGYREMVALDGDGQLVWTRSGIKDPRRSGWPYVDFFHVAASLARQRRSALFIGSGGGVALHQFASLYADIALTLVEREAPVIELAQSWFGLDVIPNLAIHIADGAEFLREAESQRWDVIIVDVFDVRAGRCPLMSGTFAKLLRRRLTPGGSVAINVIGTLGGTGAVQSTVKWLDGYFDDVRPLPVVEAAEKNVADSLRNVVVVARDERG